MASAASKARFCYNCGVREVGEDGATRKLMTCGKCKSAWYCSSACQKAQWGSHKVYCGTIDSQLLSRPELRPTLNDQAVREHVRLTQLAEPFTSAIKTEASFHAKSALRTQSPDSRHNSHILMLEFIPTPSAPTTTSIRQRFRLRDVSILTDAALEAAIDSWQGPVSGKEFLMELDPERMKHTMGPVPFDCVRARVATFFHIKIPELSAPRDTETLCLRAAYDLRCLSRAPFPLIDEDWESSLRSSLEGPEPSAEQLWERLIRKHPRGREWAAAMGCQWPADYDWPSV